jgi:hypothetical protein
MQESELFGGVPVTAAFSKIQSKSGAAPRRVSKYNTSPKERRTWEGRVYDSVLEMQMHKLLLQHFPADYIKLQSRFILQPSYCLDSDKAKNRALVYTADFVLGDLVEGPNGIEPGPGSMVLDAKGQVLASFVMSAKLFEYKFRMPVVVVKNSKQMLEKINLHKNIMNANKEILEVVTAGKPFAIKNYQTSDGQTMDLVVIVCGRQGYLDLVKRSLVALDDVELGEEYSPESVAAAREKIRASLLKKLEPEEEAAARRTTSENFTPITPDVVIVNEDPEKLAVMRLQVLSKVILNPSEAIKKSKPETLIRAAIERQLPIESYLHRINLYPGKFESVESR